MKGKIFTTDQVRGILDGRVTMFREPLKPQPELKNGLWMLGGAGWIDGITRFYPVPCHSLYNRMPYYPGDIIYVREGWMPMEQYFGRRMEPKYVYRADATSESERCREDYGIPWRSPATMPRDAARLFLRVVRVRVERVQEITEDDSKREGTQGGYDWPTYSRRWDYLYAKRGFGWDTNPWTWMVTFEQTKEENA